MGEQQLDGLMEETEPPAGNIQQTQDQTKQQQHVKRFSRRLLGRPHHHHPHRHHRHHRHHPHAHRPHAHHPHAHNPERNSKKTEAKARREKNEMIRKNPEGHHKETAHKQFQLSKAYEKNQKNPNADTRRLSFEKSQKSERCSKMLEEKDVKKCNIQRMIRRDTRKLNRPEWAKDMFALRDEFITREKAEKSRLSCIQSPSCI